MGVQVVLIHEMICYAMAGEVGEDEGLPCDVYYLWTEKKAKS